MIVAAGAADPCEGVAVDAEMTPGPAAAQASASGVSTCLCVKEGHAGLQQVGTFRGGVFMPRGLTVCAICDGTALSPRARREGITVPSEPPMTADLEALLEELGS